MIFFIIKGYIPIPFKYKQRFGSSYHVYGSLKDFSDGVKVGKASALLAASVFHFKKFSIKEVKDYLKSEGINVRSDGFGK